MGSLASRRIARVRRYSRTSPSCCHDVHYVALTLSGVAFQATSCIVQSICGAQQCALSCLSTPMTQRLPPWHAIGLGSSRFARHYYGNTFFSSGYVRWFSSPGALRSRGDCRSSRVAPFGHHGIAGCSHLPHAYRSVATSFIGTQRRGIHPVLILSSLSEHQRFMLLGDRMVRPPPGARPCLLSTQCRLICTWKGTSQGRPFTPEP